MNSEKKKIVMNHGKAYNDAVSLMKQETVWGDKEVGDYIITVACEKAEGAYFPESQNRLIWKTPEEGKNQHIEVVVQDSKDKRFIPQLEVYCKLSTLNHEEIGREKQEFLWHPFLYHYGRNWLIPEEGDYLFEITIVQPKFGRHDEQEGKRYNSDQVVLVGPLHLNPGRKPHGPE